MLRLASVNVNGLRASWRKGMQPWLETRQPDVLALQEVRAPDEIVHDLLSPSGLHVGTAPAEAKGRAGVAVATKVRPLATRIGIGIDYFLNSGRWIETDIEVAGSKKLTVVSAYVHSGEAGTPKQDDKYLFLDRMIERLQELRKESDYAVVVGDLNVGHTTFDIKNWKGNVKKAGFLPEERAYFDRFFGELGWVDVARTIAGEVDGPYTWWSNRGQAFDNDTGWRIDYQVATPELAALARSCEVDRAPSYDTRWSDHAPLVVDYDLLS
ncbi:exodeoxyribonuclease III [Saxibacter everestensis]|uniref:Exodeoxyribonuclease III n=1 Tax=Saxibacter everestensis TaxID=2909229 RepID=A0ABY8QPG6_9MICO|nr:exodeoxyribonuclease III [Brevibacteriaceae bacterium ZFBP1038]